jgi:serine/threonine-protein kinase
MAAFKHPTLTLQMKRHILSIVLAVAVLLFVVTHFFWLVDLPPRLATHFDGSGKANGWMPRQQHAALMLIFGLAIPAFILGLIWLMRMLPSKLLNVPNRDYWRAPENYPKACAIMLTWAQWLALGEFIWMTLLNRQIVLANHIKPPQLAPVETWCLAAGFVIMIGASIFWLMWRFRKTDESNPSRSAHPPTAAES